MENTKTPWLCPWSASAQIEDNDVHKLPSKQDLMRSSCCSVDNGHVLVVAAILSFAAVSDDRSLYGVCFPRLGVGHLLGSTALGLNLGPGENVTNAQCKGPTRMKR